MDKKEKYKSILLTKEKDLLNELERGKEAAKPIAPDNAIGRITRIDAMQRQQLSLHTRGRTEATLKMIKEAVLRIDAGTYGICNKCGGEIQDERLEYIPEATLCSACARMLQK